MQLGTCSKKGSRKADSNEDEDAEREVREGEVEEEAANGRARVRNSCRGLAA